MDDRYNKNCDKNIKAMAFFEKERIFVSGLLLKELIIYKTNRRR